MKVYINTLPVHDRSGGIKTFLFELIDALSRLGSGIKYELICSEKNLHLFKQFEKEPGITYLVIKKDISSPLKRIYFEQFVLNKYFNKNEHCILLNTCNIAVIKCSLPQITILHGVLSVPAIRRMFPGNYLPLSRFQKIYFDLLFPGSVKISRKTVVVSNYIKNILNDKNNKIEVIPEGVNMHRFNKKSEPKLFSFAGPYILSVSTLFPYKNTGQVIKAFSMLKKKAFPHKLVIAGKDPDGKQLKILQSVVKKEMIEEDVIFADMVPYNNMPALYKNADMFLYLSGIEAFGLPLLEAMACGIPVIASNKMAIPETVQDAALLVDPADTFIIARQMENILNSEDLKNELIHKGDKHVEQFAWCRSAEKFEKLFRNINHKA